MERRRGTELDLYTSKVGSSTCPVGGIAREVATKGLNTVSRNERRIGKTMRRLRLVMTE